MRLIRWRLLQLALVGVFCCGAFACDSSTPVEPPDATSCYTDWANVSSTYSDASQLASCDGNEKAQAVLRSLFQLKDLTIMNNQTTLTPCLDTRCDDKYVYIASNSLPHYDFVQVTPNALNVVNAMYRIPYATSEIADSVDAEDVTKINGCAAAYTGFLAGTVSSREPSYFCHAEDSDKQYFYDTIDGKKVYYRKLSCLSKTGVTISGVGLYGPNEAMNGGWGNPFFEMPSTADETYLDTSTGGALDLCLGHTGRDMHFHGMNEACFERDADGKPKHSYASAASTWNWKSFLTDDCAKESAILGWSLDGVPIKGPCVCMKRNGDGSCAVLKRARSSYVYSGLKAWGDDPKEADSLGKEGSSCSQDGDCCDGSVDKNCAFRCKYVHIEDASVAGGTSVSKRCVLLQNSWCTHQYVNRSKQDVSSANYTYLDRCNGTTGADGYAYHMTGAFPITSGCFRFEPGALPQGNAGGGGGPGGGGGGPGGGGGGKTAEACTGGKTSGCCGDGTCDGPETKDNCSEDCK